MAQQMVNGSHYDGSVTVTNRMSKRYAVVNPPFEGKHRRPQDRASLHRRKMRWAMRKIGTPINIINDMLRGR